MGAMKHVLLYMPHHTKLNRIRDKIEDNLKYSVHVVNNLREASTLMSWQQIDLALITVTRSDSIVYSLRLLQPNLPILLIAEIENQYVTERQRKWAWGVVTYDKLLDSFPKLDLFNYKKDEIEAIFLEPQLQTPPAEIKPVERHNLIQLMRVLQTRFQLSLVMLIRTSDMIGVHHERNNQQLMEIAHTIRTRWDNRPRTELISAYEPKSENNLLAPSGKPIFLITRPYQKYLLTIGCPRDKSLVQMRQILRMIISYLNSGESFDFEEFEAELEGMLIPADRFALVWKPLQQLSQIDKKTLTKILPQIGKLHGCLTDEIVIQDNYVQLVSTCPPHRSSTWLVHMYKKTSEEYMTKKLHRASPLWAAGFHVRQSQEPFKEEEITLALNG